MSKKLIIVADAHNAVLIEANGRKIKKVLSRYNIEDFDLLRDHHEHKENFNQKLSSSSHYLDPHKENKVIEREQFVSKISHIVEEKFLELHFEEMILVAEPKTLGELNNKLPEKIKSKIIKKIDKDLVKHDLHHIENEIFN